MSYFLQILISGISAGFIYAIAALGFVLIHRSSGILNFAHGHLIGLGSCLTYYFTTIIPGPIVIPIFVGICSTALMGLLIERVVIRRTNARPEIIRVTATLGLAIVCNGLVMLTPFGSHSYSLPAFLPVEPINLMGTAVSWLQLFAIVSSASVILLLAWFFKSSSIGRAIRAATDDQLGALACGISLNRTTQVSWIAATVTATLAGIIIVYQSGLEAPSLIGVGLLVLPAVILGGIDSNVGAIFGGLVIGITQQLCVGYLDTALGIGNTAGVIPFILLIAILLVKPHGIFGHKQIDRV